MADSWSNQNIQSSKDIPNRSRPSLQAPPGNNHLINRDIRENLNQIPVSVNGYQSQVDFSHLNQSSQTNLSTCQLSDVSAGGTFALPATNQAWNVQNMSVQDKRALPRAVALQEIRNSLQPFAQRDSSSAAIYGINSEMNDVDRSMLERCISLGFDEDLSREVLKASKDKSFEVALATLSSLQGLSGRKSVKSLAPGSLQAARSTSSSSNLMSASVSRNNTMRMSDGAGTHAQKLFGIPPANPWVMGSVSGSSQSSGGVLKSSAITPSTYSGGNPQFVRKPMQEIAKGPMTSNPDISFSNTMRQGERNQFSFIERKSSDTSQPFAFEGVKLRQHRPERRETMKRWSADVLQKVRNLEIVDKRSSLTYELNEKVNSMEIPDKPPPPYPYSGIGQTDSAFGTWLLNSKFSSGNNLRRIASQETLSRLGNSESTRRNSPVTILYNQKNFINVVDRVPIQGLQLIHPQVPFSTTMNVPSQSQESLGFSNTLNTSPMPVTNPPPYSSVALIKNQRQSQNIFNPTERETTMTPSSQRLFSATNQQSTVYPPYTMDSMMPLPDSHFIPINADVPGNDEIRPRRSPPPYPCIKHVPIDKRLSLNADDDSSAVSKQSPTVPVDVPTHQSDSSGNTSPTLESKESRCSPIPLTGSPCHTLIVHSDKTLECKLGFEKRQYEPYTTRLKNCSPQAFKFYMEQHVENLMKSREQRERRRHQLEIEMSRVGLSGEAQSEMRKMLVQKETNYMRLKRATMDKSMFTKVKTLGVGAFGEVALVRRKDVGNHLYAMKTLRKSEVLRRNQVAHVKAERDILAEADNEWVVKLYFSFQDNENLYFVMDYVPGGDLMALLIKRGIFEESLARFYTAELVLALESVHKMGFIHRDIKPDNILIDRDGHIKLTDFGLCTGFRWTHDSKYYQPGGNHARQPSMEPEGGWEAYIDAPCDCGDLLKHFDLCKPLERRAARQHMRCLAHSLVGTPNYIAPEVLTRIPYKQLCDWWSVGVILYEMLVGQPPFLAPSPANTQMKVINWRTSLRIPKQAKLGPEATDLTLKLLTGPENRLGNNGPEEIKTHPFFRSINWTDGLKNEPAPFIPRIRYATDTSNFDHVPQKENGSDSNGSDKEEEQRQILQKGPQHAFYEFTFRRFFDDGGHPHTLYEDVPPPYTGPLNEQGAPTGNVSIGNNNKRSATTNNKSLTIPTKVSAPPLSKSEDKAPVYV